MIYTQEKDVLRRLAEEYMRAANSPAQREKVLLWKALNRSEMQRPMVCIDQLPWSELECEELRCCVQDPFWRRVEEQLRRDLFKFRHFPVDMVIDPFIMIPKSITCTGYGLSADVERRSVDGNRDVYAQHFTNQIPEPEDVEKIQDMHFFYDVNQTAEHLQQAQEIFGSTAAVLSGGGPQFHLGVWDQLSMYMGVENIYYDLMDRPEFLHACMRRITDSVLNGIREANALGITETNYNTCHCSYIYTDDLLPDAGSGGASNSKNTWAFGLAQLFSSCSPETTREFEIPYITQMAQEFGAIYYGCCDRLDDRLDLVKTIPNVRKVSCSPWSNREHFAEQIGKKLILSNKPTPVLLAGDSFDEDAVRADLQRTVDAARTNGVNLELILKDISTVRHDLSRLTRWGEIAMEVVQE